MGVDEGNLKVIDEDVHDTGKLSNNCLIEFRCVVTVSTPAVWLARENIKRLTPRPCINVEYSHGVVYIEEWTTSVFHYGSMDDLVSQSYIYQTPLVHDSPVTRTQSSIEILVPETAPLLGTRCYIRKSSWIAR